MTVSVRFVILHMCQYVLRMWGTAECWRESIRGKRREYASAEGLQRGRLADADGGITDGEKIK